MGSVEDLAGGFDGFVEWERALERGSVDQFHDEVVGADVLELADVGVVEGGDGAGFALEALSEFGFGGFDGYGAVETGVAGFVDFAHAAFAKRREDFVGAEFVAWGEGHVGISVAKAAILMQQILSARPG